MRSAQALAGEAGLDKASMGRGEELDIANFYSRASHYSGVALVAKADARSNKQFNIPALA